VSGGVLDVGDLEGTVVLLHAGDDTDTTQVTAPVTITMFPSSKGAMSVILLEVKSILIES